ncbi:PREDICTED: O-acetyl-ADP-ribose deacetylase MACROD2-like [Rhinopithecus bieti]|uniref:O-acetyl-ADP-ribose deacetylase MACROD2-like n=1 Tax=Rhinopithecus bieti TaxID=61621 RepID=UPI00083C0167|nr:PREDICTED: O-acetyl-ADP-ribose deacetylase MACROD2-like [Rhinopithecus bieti]
MYPSNKKKKVWREEKERLLKMTLEERRKEYLRDYVPLNSILSWKEEMKGKGQNDEENTQETSQVKKSLTEKVSLYRGDITLLEVDAIVNAETESCYQFLPQSFSMPDDVSSPTGSLDSPHSAFQS